ncbi:unnamed protein product [Effrenium voratum]|nr:unnamed protein product [Effrenium voratum]
MSPLRFLCVVAVPCLAIDGGDVLDAMLGSAPEAQPVVVDPALPKAPPPIISPNKPGCAVDLTSVLYTLTLVSRYITYSTTDCSQPGQTSAVCADDITSTIRRVASTVSYLADAVFTCGNVDGSCTQTISGAIAAVASATDDMIMLEPTCFDELLCTYQVFSFLSDGVSAAKNIDTAVLQCQIQADGGDDGDDGDDGADGDGGGDSGGAPAPAPPPLTADQVAALYPGATTLAPQRLLPEALRGSGARHPSVLPPNSDGLD